VAQLSIHQETNLVEALVFIGWKKNLDTESYAVIEQLLNCSTDEAKEILDYIYLKRGLIRQVSRSAEELIASQSKSPRQWKWRAT
jgi:hypothetical protein